jgi:2-haloacid dehalogenase
MAVYVNLAPHPEAGEALQALSGYRRAILSNGTPTGLAQLARNTGLDRHLEHLVSVDELRVYKPHPKVYELATRRLEVEPGQVAFVSSNFWDVSGAASYGFRVFWINRGQVPPDPLGFVPTEELSRLTDLPAALGRQSPAPAG